MIMMQFFLLIAMRIHIVIQWDFELACDFIFILFCSSYVLRQLMNVNDW